MTVTPLPGQGCDGFTVESRGPVVSAVYRRVSYADEVGADVALGGPVLVQAGIARIRDEELIAHTTELRGATAVDLRPGQRVAICPALALAAAFGPSRFLFEDIHYRYLTWGGSITGAVELRRNRRAAFHGAASFSWRHLTQYRNPGPEARRANVPARRTSATYQEVGVTLSLVLSGQVAVRAGVDVPFGFPDASGPSRFAIPFGREEEERAVRLGLSVRLGPAT